MAVKARFVISIFGDVVGLLLFLSPIKTIRRIVREKSTLQFPWTTYMMTLVSCMLSAWYCAPFVTKHNTMLLLINMAGVLIEAVYLVIFMCHGTANQRFQIITVLCGALIFIFSPTALLSLLLFHDKGRKNFCGVVAALCSVLMYGAPLSVTWTVIQTRSVATMPLPVSACVTFCAGLWFAYGLLGNDFYVIVPNAIGCILGAIQLSIYAWYGWYHKTGSDEAGKESELL